ncbi:hypothetical protein YC2023_041641 [Brassica napus]
MKTEIEFRMNSKEDSYDEPSRKVFRVLGRMDPGHRNNEASIRLDQPGSPSWQAGCTSNSPNGRVRPNNQSNSPVRRVGSSSLPSSRPRSSLFREWIELALVSSRSESPLEFYDLETDKCEVSKDKHEDRMKMEYFREGINSTEGRKEMSKLPLGGVYKDVENPGPQETLGFLDFPPITEIDGVNFGSHNLGLEGGGKDYSNS